MDIKAVHAVYFSATYSTRDIIREENAGGEIDLPTALKEMVARPFHPSHTIIQS